MTMFLMVLVGVAMAATLGVMFAGMVGLVRSDQGGGTRSNTLMRWRVILQFVTVGLFLLLLLVMGR